MDDDRYVDCLVATTNKWNKNFQSQEVHLSFHISIERLMTSQDLVTASNSWRRYALLRHTSKRRLTFFQY